MRVLTSGEKLTFVEGIRIINRGIIVELHLYNLSNEHSLLKMPFHHTSFTYEISLSFLAIITGNGVHLMNPLWLIAPWFIFLWITIQLITPNVFSLWPLFSFWSKQQLIMSPHICVHKTEHCTIDIFKTMCLYN